MIENSITTTTRNTTTETPADLITYLSTEPTPPAYAKILKRYNRALIAQKVKCTTTYLTQILTGYKIPSKELEHRLKTLSAEIQEALNEVCNG